MGVQLADLRVALELVSLPRVVDRAIGAAGLEDAFADDVYFRPAPRVVALPLGLGGVARLALRLAVEDREAHPLPELRRVVVAREIARFADDGREGRHAEAADGGDPCRGRELSRGGEQLLLARLALGLDGIPNAEEPRAGGFDGDLVVRRDRRELPLRHRRARKADARRGEPPLFRLDAAVHVAPLRLDGAMLAVEGADDGDQGRVGTRIQGGVGGMAFPVLIPGVAAGSVFGDGRSAMGLSHRPAVTAILADRMIGERMRPLAFRQFVIGAPLPIAGEDRGRSIAPMVA